MIRNTYKIKVYSLAELKQDLIEKTNTKRKTKIIIVRIDIPEIRREK